MSVSDKIIVALDFDDVFDAMRMVSKVKDRVSHFKIGMELGYDRERDTLISHIKEQGGRIFLDLKLVDISETVARTVYKIAKSNVDMLSVYGYPDTMFAAKRGAEMAAAEGFSIQIFGISMLTSLTESDLRAAGYTVTARSLVGQRTDHAVLAGLDGLVCATEDVKLIKSWSRSTLKIITPGIRMPNGERNDQKRVATPAEAIKAGADYLVIGRPITRAADPMIALEKIIENGETAL